MPVVRLRGNYALAVAWGTCGISVYEIPQVPPLNVWSRPYGADCFAIGGASSFILGQFDMNTLAENRHTFRPEYASFGIPITQLSC